ncbi:hypothetical protein [Nitratireductor alexandrii]|uniref:hypothetical protein n=1 Tax=Nitratireductor alexandrii TaxID=2448161 RepID=UPI000FDCA458|nr:hypothetical protein [Nitratireductor alexandrii]
MSGRSITSLIRWAEHHVFGVAGQLAAAAPVVLVTMIISHQVGLEPAGKFVVAAGIAAVIFTAASLGLAAFVVVEKLQRFDTRDFLITRAFSAGLVSLAYIAASPFLSIPTELVTLVVIMRLADAAVEMSWGIDIHRLPSDQAMRRYACVNTVKLIATIVPVAFIYFLAGDIIVYLLVGASLSCVFTWYWLYRNAWGDRSFRVGVGQIRRSANLTRGASWFAVSYLVVAFTSNSPRILADHLFAGDMLGVVGVTLSFCTILGMIFLSSWLRWFPKLSHESQFGAKHIMFIMESVSILIILVVAGYAIMPKIVSILFSFEYSDYKLEVRRIILSAVIFMFGMNMTNIFKITKFVWLEPLVSIFSVLISYMIVVYFMGFSIELYLVASGACMAVSALVLSYFVQKDPIYRGAREEAS